MANFNSLQKSVFLILILLLGINIYYNTGIPSDIPIINPKKYLEKSTPISLSKIGDYYVDTYNQEVSLSDLSDYKGLKHTIELTVRDSNSEKIHNINNIEFPPLTVTNDAAVHNLHIEKKYSTVVNLVFYTPYLSSKYVTVTDTQNQKLIVLLNPLIEDAFPDLFFPIPIVLAFLSVFYRGLYDMLCILACAIGISYITQDMMWGFLLFFFFFTIILRLKICYYEFKVSNTIKYIIVILAFCITAISLLYFELFDTTVTDILLALLISAITGIFSLFFVESIVSVIVYCSIFVKYPIHSVESLSGSNYTSTSGKNKTYNADLLVNKQFVLENVQISYRTYTNLQQGYTGIVHKYQTDNKGNYIFY